MFDNFGEWDEIIKPENERHLIFIWRNIKLFENSEQLFTVIADGKESPGNYFSSVIILDKHNRDCLSYNSKIQTSLVNLFDFRLFNLSSNKKFYYLYHKLKRKYKNK